MRRKSKLITALILLFLTVAFGTSVLYPGQVSELISKGKRYTYSNHKQNDGLQKFALQATNFFLHAYPEVDHLDYQKPDHPGLIKTANELNARNLNYTRLIKIENTEALFTGLKNAVPGDLLILKSNLFKFSGKAFRTHSAGMPDHPIILASEYIGQTTIELDSLEGFVLQHANWVIDGIVFKGVCTKAKDCEHALHITGNADNVRISNNQFINFNAHVKSNGVRGIFPNRVVISNNDFFNTDIRHTTLSVTPIDVVGGDDWLIENNFIADFAKDGFKKANVAFGAFLKGGGNRGTISRNLVNCAWNLPYQDPQDIRIGLSLGGGGTGKQYCSSDNCQFEHQQGQISNNVIINCHHDVGIYLNRATNSLVESNLIWGGLGIDARFSETQAKISENLLHGRIKARNNASIELHNNQIMGLFSPQRPNIVITEQGLWTTSPQ